MPAWWRGKGKSKSKGAAAAPLGDAGSTPAAAVGKDREKDKKKASSFDEALLAKGGRGKQLQPQPQPAAAVGHPLPRPASLPSASAYGSASASASSGGSSSLGSSAASDEPPGLGIDRVSDASSMISAGRTLAIDSRKQSHVLEGHFFTNNQASEHPRLSETSVSPRKEFQLHSLNISNDRSTYCGGRKSTEIVFSTQTPSSPPSSRGYNHCPTSPVHSRAFGQCPGSPTAWQDDSRSSSSPHPLPLPPGSPCSSSHSLHSQWKKGKLLGSGTFGQVYLGFNSEGGQMCAIKEVKVISDDSNSKECLRQLNQEMVLLSQLSHPNIVQYYGSELIIIKPTMIFLI